MDFKEVDDGTVCDAVVDIAHRATQDESECDRDKGEAAAKANERDQDAEGDQEVEANQDPVDEMR